MNYTDQKTFTFCIDKMLPMKMKPTIEKMLMQNKSCVKTWWKHLSANPAAIHLLMENQKLID